MVFNYDLWSDSPWSQLGISVWIHRVGSRESAHTLLVACGLTPDGSIIESVGLPRVILNLLLLVVSARKVASWLKKPMLGANGLHSERRETVRMGVPHERGDFIFSLRKSGLPGSRGLSKVLSLSLPL